MNMNLRSSRTRTTRAGRSPGWTNTNTTSGSKAIASATHTGIVSRHNSEIRPATAKLPMPSVNLYFAFDQLSTPAMTGGATERVAPLLISPVD
jgi:hypothetical protein